MKVNTPCWTYRRIDGVFFSRKNYKYVKRDRVFPAVTAGSSDGPVSSSMDSVDGPGSR